QFIEKLEKDFEQRKEETVEDERTNIGNMYNSQAMSQNTKTSSVSYSRNFPDQHLSISGKIRN
ncbi:hypothetical protein, partial [Alistipes ihumii]|uniref:hypothetical protein n=1 Tax=Alistipes ihumii TaxID=1470347 RepID=UPI003AB1A6E9